jgi:tRNA dimethylallyltransferase
MEQSRLVLITGPTATGKTALAIELATRYGAEIVSADSRQVYRYLDIGTAKPTAAQRAAALHHLLDVVNPDEHFDTARFRTLALDAITDAWRRGKNVLVVGGTGLYLRALTRGLCPAPPADHALRARLQNQEDQEGRGFLHNWLRTVDSQAAARLHPNDTVRLIRALEVFLLSGTPLSHWQNAHGFSERPFSTLTIGLILERDALRDRITLRCRQMMDEGLVEEMRQIWELGYSPDLPSLQTIGYAQVGRLLQGQYGTEQTIGYMTQETQRLAKRQLTWLRAEPDIRWYTPMQTKEINAAVERALYLERM